MKGEYTKETTGISMYMYIGCGRHGGKGGEEKWGKLIGYRLGVNVSVDKCCKGA